MRESPDVLTTRIIALRTWFDMRLAMVERRFDAIELRLDEISGALRTEGGSPEADRAPASVVPAGGATLVSFREET